MSIHVVRWGRTRNHLLALSPLFVLLAVLFVWPLVMLVVGAFRTSSPGNPGNWTTQAVFTTFNSPGIFTAIGNSFVLALTATFAATIIAAAFAFISERTDAPLRRWITPMMVLMFATPTLFYAVGYGLLANQYSGLLNKLIQVVFSTTAAPINIESWEGLIGVMIFRKTAISYLFLIGPFRALNGMHEDASLISGASPLATFFRIDLPILAPALTGVVLLGIVSGLHAFELPLIIGSPAKIEVISTQIFEFLTSYSPPDYSRASFLSVALVIVVVLLYLIQVRLLGRRNYTTVSGKASATRRFKIRGWLRYVIGALIGSYLLIAEVLPIISLFFSSLQPYPGVYTNFTLLNYLRALKRPAVIEAIVTTVTLAVVVGGSAMAIALAVAQVSRFVSRTTAAVLRFATLIPLALPGLVTALAVVWAYVSVPGLRELYGTIWLMVVAMVVVVMPLAMQQAHAASAQIAPELLEAARIAGASAGRTLFDIVGRLIAPSFFAGWYIAGVVIVGNLDVPLLLGAPGLSTIAAEVYNLNSLGRFSEASALLVILMLTMGAIGTLGVLLAWAVRKWRQAPKVAVQVTPPLPTVAIARTGHVEHVDIQHFLRGWAV